MATEVIASVLLSIKKLLGMDPTSTQFDTDIIIYINSAFSGLSQIMTSPPSPFMITSSSDLWSTFIGDAISIELIKTYIFLKVKLVFDPPASSYVLESYNKQIGELEFRIQVATEPPIVSSTTDIVE